LEVGNKYQLTLPSEGYDFVSPEIQVNCEYDSIEGDRFHSAYQHQSAFGGRTSRVRLGSHTQP